MPASKSRRFVAGDDQVAWVTRSGLYWLSPPASGDMRAGSVMPYVVPSHVRHTTCSSQKPPILLRLVACQVTRPLMFSHVRSVYWGCVRSGS
jgi:hypothetical protein